tara:strand:+ start:3292 stop:3714 length:423 start_codon:yes stop_codon:yes gene_type:complete
MNNLENSKPIPIKYSKSIYSFNDPSSNNSSYLFNLKITLKDSSVKEFLKIEKNKFSDLIEIDDHINYNDIIYYKIEISKIPLDDTNIFKINENFNNQSNSYNKRSEDIYIEFTKNATKLTMCRCYFIGVDFNSFFISPPN